MKIRKYFPYISYKEWIKTPEFDNWCTLGDGGLKEYKKSIYFTWRKRTTAIAWVWAVNRYNQRTTSPFNGKMNYTAYYLNLGYFRIHISEKHKY